MIFDTHLHTEFSFDSQMRLTDALRRAESLGIGLVLTEHMDFEYPEEGQFQLDAAAYFAQYEPQRGDTLRLGVELGMKTSCARDNEALVSAHPFDYVIGSIHLVENTDLYHAYFYEGRSKQEIYDVYLQTMLDCVIAHPFIDALGHIDYIARYGKYEDPNLYYRECSEGIDLVLRAILANDTVLELNTRRLRDQAAAEVLLPLYRRYQALGGQYVTLGSDAHKAANIGSGFALARELAAACGLRPVYFKERRLKYME